MIIFIESIILCILFTIFVYVVSKNPIKSLYNYPPKIQERVKKLPHYTEQIPSKKNKVSAKLGACIIFITILTLTLYYINNCYTFFDAFINGFILWTIVNIYDVVFMDIIWFCHSKKFVLKGTEDMKEEYHNYLYHVRQGIIGEFIGIIICIIVGIIIQHILI